MMTTMDFWNHIPWFFSLQAWFEHWYTRYVLTAVVPFLLVINFASAFNRVVNSWTTVLLGGGFLEKRATAVSSALKVRLTALLIFN